MTMPLDPGPEPRRVGPPDHHGGDVPPGPTSHGGFRYARWDGRQRLPELSADEILERLSDDLMAEGDLAEALRRLMQRGLHRSGEGTGREDLAGLRELMGRLAQRRRELLERYQLGDVLSDVREELAAIVDIERHGIERRMGEAATETAGDEALRGMLADMAAKRQAALDALPRDTGGRIRGLQDYDFLEPAARERFDALQDRLRKQVLDSYFQGLAESIKDVTPEALAANREMVRDLNYLLQERLDGGDPDASEFLARHGKFFPGARTLDDIIQQLAARMAAMQSLLASLTPAQRDELRSMMDALLRDDRLRWDLAQLAATMDELFPGGLGDRLPFRGDEPLSLAGALEQMGRIERMDRLADNLSEGAGVLGAPPVDIDEVRELLDEQSAQELEALQQLSRTLEEAGYVERQGESVELTPRGARKLGQTVLDELFRRLRKDAFGGHPIDVGGFGGERTDDSRPFEFGRPFHLDLKRTLSNALVREENGVARGRRPLRLAPEDFEIFQTEQLSDASTVLLVDMSRSMLLRGCFLAAKKVAVALDTLIRTQFPRDELHVVGFAYYAREIRPGALAGLSWQGYEYGTNLQHGLMLARRLLAKSHSANREIVVITDGEPTAHFEAGQVEFSYPPTRRTIQETLREVARCTREGIVINTFMLERSRALAEFVDRMTRLNRGRAFYATPEHLGEYVLVDYVGKKSRRD
jgi:uncharacterized protein with von Willebrand factor type A (vWA) domain